jgi:hypothetical protein
MPIGVGIGPGPIIIEIPETTIVEYFKAYFNITTETAYMITGTKLQDFLTARAANILSTDADYAEQTLLTYNANLGNFDNSATSTQKWVMPYPGMLNTGIAISAMVYSNILGVERVILRVTNSSIVDTFGYPGIIPSGGGGGGIPID